MILTSGTLVLADLDPVVGNEQGRRRPAVVISHPAHLEQMDGRLVTISPITSRQRHVPNHIPITPAGTHQLDRPSWVMTEQVRTISTRRVRRTLGTLIDDDLRAVMRYVYDYLAELN